MTDHWGVIFPEKCTFEDFKRMTELFMVRRTVITLADYVGLEMLRRGLKAPIVCRFKIDLPVYNGKPAQSLDIHTTAPPSKTLNCIEETE
mmetsp:Transcript_48649/g.128696  ORF Transcript_48649/g.128696 Transcript_48649/m.128696 type:complete len:90 (-) Transcript_48649:426-695(-)